MKTIKLRSVKRCDNCHHLIPYNYKSCPYCQGTYFEKSEQEGLPVEEPAKIKLTMPTISAKTKKNIVWALVSAAVIVGAVFGVQYYQKLHRLDKSITEELSMDDIEEIEKDYPGFALKYDIIDRLRSSIQDDSSNEKYKTITYSEMMQYMDQISDAEMSQKLIAQAELAFDSIYHKPLVPEVDAVVKRWSAYIEDNTIKNYIQVECHERYVYESPYYKAGFYFTIEYPKGKVQDCQAHYGLVSQYSDSWEYDCNSYGDLSALEERCEANEYRWNNKYSYSEDIYDYYKMKCEITSVTTSEGRVITADDLDRVPSCVNNYIQSQNKASEIALIRELIDPEYPDEDECVAQMYNEELKKINPNCYELLDRSGSLDDIRRLSFSNIW